RLTSQLLQRVIADAEVVEILLDQFASFIAELLVEHRAAVARDAVGATLRHVTHEQQRAAKLSSGQSLVISGQKPVPCRVARNDRTQKRRDGANDRVVVDQIIEIA